MSHSKPEVMQAKKVRVDGKPMSPKDEVISPKKLKGVSKNPWECRVKKMAKEGQEKQMGQGCSKGNKWDKRAHEQCKTKPK